MSTFCQRQKKKCWRGKEKTKKEETENKELSSISSEDLFQTNKQKGEFFSSIVSFWKIMVILDLALSAFHDNTTENSFYYLL